MYSLCQLTYWGREKIVAISQTTFPNAFSWISIKISLKFVPKVGINNNPALIQIIAWRRPGDNPLSEPMMVSLLTHICITRPQWVNLPKSQKSCKWSLLQTWINSLIPAWLFWRTLAVLYRYRIVLLNIDVMYGPLGVIALECAPWWSHQSASDWYWQAKWKTPPPPPQIPTLLCIDWNIIYKII